MIKNFRIGICVVMLLLVAACGGGGGGSGADLSTGARYLSGVAEDEPISGARIKLVEGQNGEVVRSCGASGRGRCEALTADNGTFNLHIAPDLSLDHLEIVATGGFDNAIGALDEYGIVLRAPMVLFAGREEEVIISPMTSVLAELIAAGVPLSGAEVQVRDWLHLDSVRDIAYPPSSSQALQAKTHLVTSIALMLADSGDEHPFATLAAGSRNPLLVYDGSRLALNGSFLDDIGLSPDQQAEIGAIFEILGATADDREKAFLVYQFKQTADQVLAADPQFDPEQGNYLHNLGALSEQVLFALESSRLPFLGHRFAIKRIARYVFNAYGLTTFAAFAAEGDTFLAGLRHPESGLFLREDPHLADLAEMDATYSVRVPLLSEEMPGNDNRRRLDYFYGSDLSPFYLAETINSGVFDDQFSDPVMAAIAVGMAKAGLLAEAETIIDTQVFQPALRGEAYNDLAKVMISFNRFAEAIAVSQKAERLFKQVIESKGYSGIASTDTNRLQLSGINYRLAGDLSRSLSIFEYLRSIARNLNSPTLYGSVIVGTWQVVDLYQGEGRTDLAIPLVDFMYSLALETPANVTNGKYSFKAKVFYLVETAKRYSAAGNPGKIDEIYQVVQAIRTNDGYQNLTSAETWAYMVDFVELLYQMGQAAEAHALAAEMPTAYALKAYKLVATYEAVQNGLPAALAVIDAHIPLLADQIEALTYFSTNKSREYIALALIDRYLLDAAKQALDAALTKVASLSPGTDADRYQQLIQFGYVKIADLYALAGDANYADYLLREKAEAVLASLGGLKYRVDALNGIALGYYNLGQSARSQLLLTQAKSEISAAVAAAVPPADGNGRGKFYEDFALLYESVFKACDVVGARALSLEMADAYAGVARRIFDPSATYVGSGHDTYGGKEVDKLLKAAEYRRRGGDGEGAVPLVAEAEATAWQLWVEVTRVGKLVSTVAGYAAAGEFTTAVALAESFTAAADRFQALQAIATTYAGRDDFPATDVASIDSDYDGFPDFFSPLATADEIAASGLILDEDSDGDGVADITDRRPFFRDPSSP